MNFSVGLVRVVCQNGFDLFHCYSLHASRQLLWVNECSVLAGVCFGWGVCLSGQS